MGSCASAEEIIKPIIIEVSDEVLDQLRYIITTDIQLGCEFIDKWLQNSNLSHQSLLKLNLVKTSAIRSSITPVTQSNINSV